MNAAIEKVVPNFLSAEELKLTIQGCALNDRLSQKKIYTSFYNYAMSICSIYTNNYEDSVEILNDGFLKVLKKSIAISQHMQIIFSRSKDGCGK
jgi:hypothetical protein